MEFEDGVIPDTLDMIPLIITRPDGEPATSKLNKHTPRLTLVDLPLGTYSIQEDTSGMQIDGYNLLVIHTAHLEGEDPVAGHIVTLSKENPTGHITIVNRYKEIEPDHVHKYVSAITEPTCTENGYITHICECADNYTDSYVNKLGHDWGDYVRYDNGLRIRECSVCKAQDKIGSVWGYLFIETDSDEDVKALIENKRITVKTSDSSSRTMRAVEQDFIIGSELATHTVKSVDTSNIQIDGYDLTVKYMAGYEGEELFESNSLTLTERKPVGRINIILYYTAIRD